MSSSEITSSSGNTNSVQVVNLRVLYVIEHGWVVQRNLHSIVDIDSEHLGEILDLYLDLLDVTLLVGVIEVEWRVRPGDCLSLGYRGID